jgi:PAS domain S-box-containing protein
MLDKEFDIDRTTLFNEILNLIKNGVLVFKEKVIYSNAAAEKMLGYSSGQLVGKEISDIFPTDHRLIHSCLSDVSNECQIKGDFSFKNAAGEFVFFNSEIKSSIFQNCKCCVVTFSEKEKNAATKDDDLFRILTENSFAGIYIYKDKYIYANPEFLDKTGYNMKELKEMTPWELIHESERDLVKENVRRRLSGEIFEQKYYERKIITKSGEIKTFRVATNTVQIDGEYAGLGSVVDISDLKALQDDLKDQVKEETRKRYEQEQLLVQKSKLADMGEMIRSIAHQWKQPLSAVNMLVQDMINTYENGGLTKDYIHWVHDTAVEQISYMTETINDFMSFLRPSDKSAIFSLDDALIPALKIFSHQVLSHDLVIEMKCSWRKGVQNIQPLVKRMQTEPVDSVETDKTSQSNVLIYGHHNEFMQVLLNIFNNSKDAISLAKRKKRLSENGKISINLKDLGERISIEIEDNGGGIPEEIQPLVFEPYFTTKNKEDGSGIGLYMVKAIIENNMKGEVKLRNGEKGAILSIILDKHKEEQ